MVHWKARRTSRESAAAAFAGERDAILTIVGRTPADQLSVPVLIKRLQGLEDSSRDWSVLMTLDHLRIVNQEISGVIASLCAGQVPERVASTAAVKPSAAVDASVIPAFEATCRDFEMIVASMRDLKTPIKFPHPWFGPLDAASWHFMSSFHMRLHRKQIEHILAGLPKNGIIP